MTERIIARNAPQGKKSQDWEKGKLQKEKRALMFEKERGTRQIPEREKKERKVGKGGKHSKSDVENQKMKEGRFFSWGEVKG